MPAERPFVLLPASSGGAGDASSGVSMPATHDTVGSRERVLFGVLPVDPTASPLKKLPTHSVGALSFLYPIFAMVVDFVAFDHRLKPLQLVGSAAILIAAAGMTLGWSLHRKKASSGA